MNNSTNRADGARSSPAAGSTIWRTLEEDELPAVGDEAWVAEREEWETVNVPSMWLAGGQRIEGTIFRRRIPSND